MKRTNVEQLIVLAGLVTISVGLRFYFQEIPNFAPVAALALFAGYYFDRRWMAACAPLATMLISDTFIGGYQPLLMLTVYGLLTLPVLAQGVLRQHFAMAEGVKSTVRSFAGLLSCSLAASVLFFTVSNFMTWVVTPWYERSWEGLVGCYLSALPFFRYTLMGDAAFAVVLFGVYAVGRQFAAASAWKLQAVQTRI